MTAMLVEEGASLELICNYTGKSIFDVANEDMIDVILQAQRSPARAEGLKKTHVREKTIPMSVRYEKANSLLM